MGSIATDTELVEASRRGEHAAFGELVERYQRIVCAVAYAGTRDRSLGEDVAQETFVTAWRRLDQLRDVARVRPWLCGIARNLARKARRQRLREMPTDDISVISATTPFDEMSELQTDRIVAAALGRVPATYREPLVLYYCQDRSVADVAEALGITQDATHQRLSRGRQLVAADVAPLVERTLASRRARRNLAACVLAALSIAVAPSHAAAATRGWTMLKIGFAALAIAALAVGHVERSSARAGARSSAESAPAATATTVARPSSVATGRAAPRAAAAPQLPAIANAPATATSSAPAITTGSGSVEHADCAKYSRHMAELAAVQFSDVAGDDIAKTTTAVQGGLEKVCTDRHFPTAFLDCVMGQDDIWTMGIACKHFMQTKQTRPQTSETADASCAAVGAHVTALIGQIATKMVPGEQTALLDHRFESMPQEIEASCTDASWPEETRRCMVAAATMDAMSACM